MSIAFACGNCGKVYKADDRFAGKKATCKACGTVNIVPIPTPPVASDPVAPKPIAPKPVAPRPIMTSPPRAPSRPAPISPAPPDEHLDLNVLEQAAAEAQVRTGGAAPLAPVRAAPGAISACPGCGSRLDPGAVFCVGCGYDIRSGRQKITKVLETDKVPGPRMPAPADTGNGDLRATTAGSANDDFASVMAMRLIIVGGTSGLLPLVGLQWRGMHQMGTGAFLLGAALAGAGVVIYVIKQNWGGVTFGVLAALLTLGVYAVSEKNAKSDDDVADSGKRSLRSPRRVASSDDDRPPASSGQSNPTPPPPVSSGGDDFMYNGRPKIRIEFGGTRTFGHMISYRAELTPPGQDPIEFYRPGLRQSNADVRLCAVDLIRKYSPADRKAEAAAAIAEVIGDSSAEVRGRAVEAQGMAKNPATVAALIGAMNDSEVAIRREAIRILAQFQDPASIDALIAHISDDQSTVMNALSRFGPEHKEKIAAAYASLLGHSEPKQRLAALNAVIARNPDGCAEQILNLVDDADPIVRQTAMGKLADLKHEPAIEKIAARLGQDGYAMAALAKYGPAAYSAVAAKAADGDSKIRATAIRLLGGMGNKECMELIRTAARDDEMSVSAAAREAWAKIDPATATPVSFAMLDLETGDEKKQMRGLHELLRLKPDASQPAVAKRVMELMLSSAEAPLSGQCARVLAIWGDKACCDALIEFVSPEADEARRRLAVPILAQRRDPRAIAPLCECLAQNKDWIISRDAIRLYGPAAEDELIKQLARGENSFGTRQIIDLLKEVGTRKSLLPLAAIARDSRHFSRNAARDAATEIQKRLK